MIEYTRNHLTFKAFEFGPPAGELVVLLHGFPANAASWRPVAMQLAAHGYRVLVLEQRGFSESARPQRRQDYSLPELVDDVAALLKAVNATKAHIVGHDWGGLVAWAFASKYPEQTASLVVVSTPHPQAFTRSLRSSRQAFLSWYIAFFQLPYLPEGALRFNKGNFLRRWLIKTGLNKTATAAYVANMQQKEYATATVNWYRALRERHAVPDEVGLIAARTLFVYGSKDNFVSEEAAKLTGSYVTGTYEFLRLPQANHWIPEELPDVLADRIEGFIGRAHATQKLSWKVLSDTTSHSSI